MAGYSNLSDLGRKLDYLTWLVRQVLAREDNIMAALDDLETQVAETETVEQSALVLINGIAAQIAAAGGSPQKLAALQASLKASADSLAAAVAANTPAAPPAPPASPAHP